MVEEEEKMKIQNDLRILTERLARVNESLAKKIAARTEYDRTIAETEAAYMKVSVETDSGCLMDAPGLHLPAPCQLFSRQ